MQEDHLWSTAGFYFGSRFVQHLYMMFLFLHEAQFTGYADDNTPFVVRDNIPDVINATFCWMRKARTFWKQETLI